MSHLWERVRTFGPTRQWTLYVCVHCGTKKRLLPASGLNPEKRAEYKQPGERLYSRPRPRCYVLRPPH